MGRRLFSSVGIGGASLVSFALAAQCPVPTISSRLPLRRTPPPPPPPTTAVRLRLLVFQSPDSTRLSKPGFDLRRALNVHRRKSKVARAHNRPPIRSNSLRGQKLQTLETMSFFDFLNNRRNRTAFCYTAWGFAGIVTTTTAPRPSVNSDHIMFYFVLFMAGVVLRLLSSMATAADLPWMEGWAARLEGILAKMICLDF